MNNNELLNSLAAWCRNQRDTMARANELMNSGRMHTGSSDGVKMVDTTAESIAHNERSIAELDVLLLSIANGAYDAHRP